MAASAIIGLVVGGLLWVVWEPTTHECGTLGECLGAPFWAAVWTLGLLVAVLAVRRSLGLRPVLLPTVLAFVGGGAVLVTIQALGNIWPRDLHEPLAPWWSWVLVGGLTSVLAHWSLQPGRSRAQRVLPPVVVVALVVGGLTWVGIERDRRQLLELESVGVDTVMAPTFEDFSVTHAGRRQVEGVGDLVSISLSPASGAVPAWPDAYLVPVDGRDLCALALQMAWGTVTCVETDGGVELTDDHLLGAGAREGDTLLLVTVRISPSGDEPDGWTRGALRTAVDRRVLTTLRALRDGDVG